MKTDKKRMETMGGEKERKEVKRIDSTLSIKILSLITYIIPMDR